MERAIEVIDGIARRTDMALLFHSASGKDSIAMLDLIAPRFRRVVCVYMYITKGLEHINRYINWAQSRYTNATFVQVPHYAVSSYIKYGFLGCKQNPKQKIVTLADITYLARRQYGIEWAFFGFKQSDSLNRRVMLRTYDMEAICEKTKKAYPLSTYKNADILAYIERNGLIRPERYGVHQSAGTAVNDIGYLLWLRDNFPNDLGKVIATYPMTERILFEHDYKTKTERDARHQA
jgi:sulfate adenylyltransferase subunit 2